ncbi:hypothetical protein TrRE_jg7248 [Triparma retinervis]|uniref:Uncharacterized protein n=1 Tax=Triparma retinervis TaxID=2557542 RepID=A0A9W6ZLN6_9STRA|nr:hypothetical protein TrRE_jg7248 [Triparma retinervis]
MFAPVTEDNEERDDEEETLETCTEGSHKSHTCEGNTRITRRSTSYEATSYDSTSYELVLSDEEAVKGDEEGVKSDGEVVKGPIKKYFGTNSCRWSKAEDACLVKGVKAYGRSWKQIKYIYKLDRSQSAISNRWAYLNGRRPGKKGGDRVGKSHTTRQRGGRSKKDTLDCHVVAGFIKEDDDFLYF